MIFERMIGFQGLRRIKQFETLIKTNSLLPRNNTLTQSIRSSSFLVAPKQCTNLAVINGKANGSLLKSTTSCLTVHQTRLGSVQGDHVRMWMIERIIAVAIPVLIPAALISENPIIEGVLAILIVMHTHWGLEAVVIDYARPIVVGTVIPKVAHLMLHVTTILTLVGLFVLIYNGPGIAKSIKSFWAIGKQKPQTKD